MRTSIRINANVWRRTARNPARPESAATMSRPSGASIAVIATRWLSRSLTTRTDGRGVAFGPRAAMLSFAVHQRGHPRSDGLCHRPRTGSGSGGSRRRSRRVWRCSRWRPRQGSDRAPRPRSWPSGRRSPGRPPQGRLADRPDRRVPVHDRHHDVHQHEVDVGCLARARRSLPPRFRPRGPRHRRVPAGR